MKSASADLDSRQMTSGVQRVFAQVTRYPLEILDPEAALEEDLGIDSVKLGEVFAVLRETYALPPVLGIPPEQLRTIGGIAGALTQYLVEHGAESNGNGNGNGSVAAANGNPLVIATGNGHAAAAPAPLAAAVPAAAAEAALPAAPAEPVPPARSSKHSNGSLEPVAFEAAIRAVFAQVTRYPLEILDSEAALEEDLGIDSVKLGEVFAVLRERYELPPQIGIPPEELKTIGSIARALRRYLSTAAASVPAIEVEVVPPPPAPAPIVAEISPVAAQSFAALTPALKPFAGKVALVTGSGRGLGKDIAAYLAELGATVVVNSFHSREQGIRTAAEIQDAGGEAMHVWGSVANPDHVDTIFREVEERYGALDFFISSASNGMLARLEDITVEHWEKAFRTNVVGLHQSAMRAAKLMRKRGGGKIITLSSPAAHGYVDYFGCMGAVKAAVESLTRSLAIELAKDNIQVNCVSPGPVYGELLQKWPESERLVKQWEGNTAYGRLCEARDVSHFVAYLLSEPVKLFTGSVLILDGGISSQGW
ncbi:MAG TPA: SDR family oxidoreductase [Thermoanaerobaculia bacterium]|nr:SDR family oxidoreductase [Thermoanaerobaculia bacterium]